MEPTRPLDLPILKFFTYEHLPTALHLISGPFATLAHEMVGKCKDTRDVAELVAGLRKLLEAKDCCVRAAMAVPR